VTAPRVIGLDLSLTGTGIADFKSNGEVITGTIRTKSYGSAIGDQWQRLQYINSEIWRAVAKDSMPALVIVEGPSYGSKGAGTWDRAGLWWTAVQQFLCDDIPLAVVPPAVLKKYATGRGNADKTAMAVALQKRWGVELGDDNKVDAWWLAAAGREHLGRPYVDLPKAQREALAKATWPAVNA
jgi:Holliday junction resolvasome RuvABC endonuclease subunit